MPNSLFFRDLVNVENIGKEPGFTLHLSDGGHIENLGILPLLKRRVKRIIVADAGLHNSRTINEDILVAMKYARDWLGCQFSAADGTDIDFRLINDFQGDRGDKQPHCIKINVSGFYLTRLVSASVLLASSLSLSLSLFSLSLSHSLTLSRSHLSPSPWSFTSLGSSTCVSHRHSLF